MVLEEDSDFFRFPFSFSDQAAGGVAQRLFGGFVGVVDRLFGAFGGLAHQLLGTFSAWSQPAMTSKDVNMQCRD
jgi:hypothetical protein